jgi:hypothetical protein
MSNHVMLFMVPVPLLSVLSNSSCNISFLPLPSLLLWRLYFIYTYSSQIVFKSIHKLVDNLNLNRSQWIESNQQITVVQVSINSACRFFFLSAHYKLFCQNNPHKVILSFSQGCCYAIDNLPERQAGVKMFCLLLDV